MRIIIIGGVAAGMSAAARARRHSEEAEIIVLERGPEVSFANCGLPYHVSAEIDDARDLRLHTPDSLKAALNLDVRTRHDVIAIDTAAQTVTALTPDGAETVMGAAELELISNGAGPGLAASGTITPNTTLDLWFLT